MVDLVFDFWSFKGGLVNVLEHPNQERYPGQLSYVVDIEQYLYLVLAEKTDGILAEVLAAGGPPDAGGIRWREQSLQ